MSSKAIGITDRDILCRALGGNANVDDAENVLSQALENLHLKLWAAACWANEANTHTQAEVNSLLVYLCEQARALEFFVDKHLYVQFADSEEVSP